MLCLAGLLSGLPLAAQLDDKPESWARVEGHYLVDADIEQVAMLMHLARGAAQRAASGQNRRPAAYDLLRLGFDAFQAQSWNLSARLLARGLAIEQGLTPGEWLEVASSLQFQLDRRVVRPGTVVHARLSPQFVFGRPLNAKFGLRLSLLGADGKALREIKKTQLEEMEASEFSVATAGLADGEYKVQYQLSDSTGKVVVEAVRALSVSTSLAPRLKALQAQSEKLALTGVARRSLRHALAVQSLNGIGATCDRAQREAVDGFEALAQPVLTRLAGYKAPYYSTDPIQPERDLPVAERLAASLLAGGDPLESERGDLRLAIRSGQDDSLQPFRLYVPKSYNAGQKWPLIVLLHGLGGDEGSYFERIPEVTRLAEERGYLLASPRGRSAVGDLSGQTAGDIFDILEMLKQCYSIDPRQVFLSGHSSGGGAVVPLSLHPRALAQGPVFAALAAVSGVPIQALDYSKAPAIPVLLLQAGKGPRLSDCRDAQDGVCDSEALSSL